MTAWIAIVGAGVAVYSMRALLLLGRVRMPVTMERTLAYVAPAALAALVAPAVLNGTSAGWTEFGPRAIALAAGAVVAHRTRSVGATVAAGMAVLWAATATLNGLG